MSVKLGIIAMNFLGHHALFFTFSRQVQAVYINSVFDI